MNIDRLGNEVAIGAATRAVHCGAPGLLRRGEADIGEAFWCRHLDVTLGVCEGIEGVVRATRRSSDRGSAVDDIF